MINFGILQDGTSILVRTQGHPSITKQPTTEKWELSKRETADLINSIFRATYSLAVNHLGAEIPPDERARRQLDEDRLRAFKESLKERQYEELFTEDRLRAFQESPHPPDYEALRERIAREFPEAVENPKQKEK